MSALQESHVEHMNINKSELSSVAGRSAGFIGSHLVEALLSEGYRVRVIDNLATGHLSNLAHLEGRFEWIEGSVADFGVCRRAAEGERPTSSTRRRSPVCHARSKSP